MYLRPNRRFKDGKEHCYWSIVESKRCAGGKVVQRQVLYLGEINDSQQEAWRRVIEAFDERAQQTTQLALFPADRPLPDHAEGHGVQIRLGAMQLHRPRQWGACRLACQLYEQLALDRFWAARLPDSREGTCWSHILETLVSTGSSIQAANGVCTGCGSSKAPWAICSAKILRWSRRTRSIVASTSWSSTNRRCSRICVGAGRICSAPASTSFSTT